MSHGSKLDANIWVELRERGDELVIEGVELIQTALEGCDNDSDVVYAVVTVSPEGLERTVLQRKRINQQYF